MAPQPKLGARPATSARPSRAREQIVKFFGTLANAWGPQHWWPAQTPFEVIVGAYLTQSTSWINVEHVLDNLRTAGRMSIDGVRGAALREIEKLIRSSGYFRQKARRLKLFVEFVDHDFGGSLERMFATPTAELREKLLALHGVGPETADSILLYAGNHPVFVVDAYMRRVFSRHRLIRPKASYDEIRQLVESALTGVALPDRGSAPNQGNRGAAHAASVVSATSRPARVQVLNEMHALIVGVGKDFCLKSEARCEGCPLEQFPHDRRR